MGKKNFICLWNFFLKGCYQLIKLIIKRFVKNYKDIENKDVRESYGVLSGVLGILCNLFLFILKLTIGLFMNSIAIISDAFNNLSDMGTSIVTILGVKMSNSLPDEEHPFGHGRIEYVSSLVVSFIIMLVGFELLKSSIGKVRNPEEIIFNSTLIFILLMSVLIKLWMFSYNSYIGKTINSSINKATATDSLNDVIATSAVILSTVAGYYLKINVDGFVGVIVSLIIMYTGFNISKDTVNVLLGQSPSEETVNKVCGFIENSKYIVGMHDLRIHDYGPGRSIGSVHVELLDTLELVQAHAIVDEIEKDIMRQTGIDIVIHVDPVGNVDRFSNQ